MFKRINTLMTVIGLRYEYHILNDRLSPTRRRVNLHVGVDNRLIPNNLQTAKIIRTSIKRATCKLAAENNASVQLVLI